jgi:hypothetical protein
MGEVIDFKSWADDNEILLLTDPCPRPFHNEDYVRDLECRRCWVKVELTTHPSFDSPRWYG